jgi:DHA2 family multidrug resistance protein-like MFS transporter
VNVSSPRAGRREWTGLAVIALPCMLYSMDLTVLNLAVPSLSADLQPSATQLLWIVDIYGFSVAGMLITMGTLGDRIGRRRLLLLGAGAFGAASVLAAFSTSAAMLIVMRALLGIAGATLAPSTLSLIRNMFHDPRQRSVAIGVWIASYSAGAAIGPLLGGVLLQYFWWGSVFLVSVPVMVLLLVVGPVLLPEYRNSRAGRIDLVSAALSLVAVLATIYGIKRLAEHGLAWPPFVAIALGVAVLVLFLLRQARLADPLIDLRLFRAPAFSAALAIYALATFIAFGMFLFVGQFMQLVLGFGPLRAGLWSTPFAAAFILGSMATPLIARRIKPGFVIAGGLVIAAAGFTMLAQVDADSDVIQVVTAFVVYSLGLAPVFTLATDQIVGCAPPERAGAASALSETGSEFGGALGIAILGSIGTAIYRGALAEAPPGVTPEVLETARSTLGAATAAAQHLNDGAALALLDASRSAFVAGQQAGALVAAVVALATAILAAVVLGRSTPSGSVAQAREA